MRKIKKAVESGFSQREMTREDEMSLLATEQMNKGERVFLEVVRIDDFGKSGATSNSGGGGEFRYLAWCAKCGAKVFLVAKNDSEFWNAATATAALHVRLVFADKLLVCRNSISPAMGGNIPVT